MAWTFRYPDTATFEAEDYASATRPELTYTTGETPDGSARFHLSKAVLDVIERVGEIAAMGKGEGLYGLPVRSATAERFVRQALGAVHRDISAHAAKCRDHTGNAYLEIGYLPATKPGNVSSPSGVEMRFVDGGKVLTYSVYTNWNQDLSELMAAAGYDMRRRQVEKVKTHLVAPDDMRAYDANVDEAIGGHRRVAWENLKGALDLMKAEIDAWENRPYGSR